MILPVALLCGLGANWYAAKELDDVVTFERARRPISDFWGGLFLGGLLGLWLGMNCGDALKRTWGYADWALGLCRLGAGRPAIGGSAAKEDSTRQPESKPGPPQAQYQAVTQGQHPPGYVYYQPPPP